MKTYLVGGFFYRIIKAKNPTDAWIKYITEDVDIQKIWSKESARQELIKLGFKKLKTSNARDVYEVFK